MLSPVRPHSFVRLSVCKITQKHVHGFGWNVTCCQMSGRGRTWLTFEPNPDHSSDAGPGLLSPIAYALKRGNPYWAHVAAMRFFSRMHCNVEFYYVGKIPHTGIGHLSKQRRMVLRRWNTIVGGQWRSMRSTECTSSWNVFPPVTQQM